MTKKPIFKLFINNPVLITVLGFEASIMAAYNQDIVLSAIVFLLSSAFALRYLSNTHYRDMFYNEYLKYRVLKDTIETIDKNLIRFPKLDEIQCGDFSDKKVATEDFINFPLLYFLTEQAKKYNYANRLKNVIRHLQKQIEPNK